MERPHEVLSRALMRHCPNAECPFRKKFGYAAEYRPGVEQCSDCGAALVDGESPAPAAAPAPPKPSLSSDVSSRLVVTIVLLFAVAVAMQVRLVGITYFDRKPGGGFLDLFGVD